MHGYEFDDYGNGMLFASRHSVAMHTDEKPSVVWILKDKKPTDESLQLIAAGQFVNMEEGNVYIVDTTKLHAVLSIQSQYVLYCAYIRHAEG